MKRLFGPRGAGVPCNLCRCDIPASDLEEGRAVVIARQQYCHGCVEEITRRALGRNPAGWTLPADLGSSSTVLLR
ncbi:MAG: hypothetical protein HY293_07215 [Planctomycetes bacterium]|nr:hypothetical protein [Planctomycetota bacterium]